MLVLPEPYDISFRIFDIGSVAHIANLRLFAYKLAALFDDFLRGSVYIIHINRYHGGFDWSLSLQHAPVNGSRLSRRAFFVNLGRYQASLLHFRHTVHLPSEYAAAEFLRAAHIIRRNLKMYALSICNLGTKKLI